MENYLQEGIKKENNNKKLNGMLHTVNELKVVLKVFLHPA